LNVMVGTDSSQRSSRSHIMIKAFTHMRACTVLWVFSCLFQIISVLIIRTHAHIKNLLESLQPFSGSLGTHELGERT
jgi:hypothetical protein